MARTRTSSRSKARPTTSAPSSRSARPSAAASTSGRSTKTDAISVPTVGTAIEQGLFARDGVRTLVFTNLQNFAQVSNSGVDVDLQLRFTGRRSVTSPCASPAPTTTTSGRAPPRATRSTNSTAPMRCPWRNAFVVTTDYGPWSGTAALRSVGGFWDIDEAYPIPEGTRKVGSYTEMDIQGQYTGWKNLTLDRRHPQPVRPDAALQQPEPERQHLHPAGLRRAVQRPWPLRSTCRPTSSLLSPAERRPDRWASRFL